MHVWTCLTGRWETDAAPGLLLYEAAAEDLWVDLWTFETRLGTLEPDESVYLSARLAEALLGGA